MKPELIIGGVSYPWTFACWTYRTLAGFIADNVAGRLMTGTMNCGNGQSVPFNVQHETPGLWTVEFFIPGLQKSIFVVTKHGVIELTIADRVV